jgi:hypothetical protein
MKSLTNIEGKQEGTELVMTLKEKGWNLLTEFEDEPLWWFGHA